MSNVLHPENFERIPVDGNLRFGPALAVHHTRGLGPINGLRQMMNWMRMGKPRDFDE